MTEINKTPRTLNVLTLADIYKALSIVANLQYRIRGEYNGYNREYSYGAFQIKEGILSVNCRTIFKLFVQFREGEKLEHISFHNSGDLEYTDFYKRNKYEVKSMKEDTDKFEIALAAWQTKHSKNHKKDVDKIMFQFRQTNSVQAALKVLGILPKLMFADTQTFSTPITFNVHLINIPKDMELKKQHKEEIKKTIAKIKSLESELENTKLKLTSLKNQQEIA